MTKRTILSKFKEASYFVCQIEYNNEGCITVDKAYLPNVKFLKLNSKPNLKRYSNLFLL